VFSLLNLRRNPLRFPGPLELVIILGILLLVFGASKLPEIGSAVGRSMKNFKKGITSEEESNTKPKKTTKKTST
tara:strand:+ start:3169 stop:3390 length:222 start_codon:yes stop_codon:yes gene_type:complete